MTKKKKSDEAPDKKPDEAPDKKTTDLAFVPKLTVGNWQFGYDPIDGMPTVMTTQGNWVWRGVTTAALARAAKDLAELANKVDLEDPVPVR